MQIVTELPEDTWQAFVDGHPLANVFHTPAMQQVFAGAKGHEPLLRAAVADDGRVLALLTAVDVRLTGGPLARLTSRSIAYGGVLCAEGHEGQDALEALLRWHNDTADHRHLFTEMRHRSDAHALRPVWDACGYAHEPELNFLIDLRPSPEAIWQALNRTARKNVRRAKRDGLIAQEVTCSEELDGFYGLLQQVYSDAEVPLADISLFRSALELLRQRGMARFVLARSPQGDMAGARVVLLYKGGIFDWYAGASRELRNSRPNDFLVWHTLQWGATHGYHTFDFGGAGHPDVPYGVRDFKAKFGGQLVNYGRERCVHAPRMLWLSETGYRVLRRFL
jgi:lipid II:glycine glycyltransferase (peptidoglycan interpeptide bridge formation enzyme)